MRPSRRWTERLRAEERLRVEDGSASLEFLTVGLILLVPIVYLVLAVAAVQGGAFAVEGAARHAARIAVLQHDEVVMDDAIEDAVRLALDDYGVDASRADIAVDCSAADCLAPGVRVEVSVRAEITLPLVPDLLSLDRVASVPVQAASVQTVSRLSEPSR